MNFSEYVKELMDDRISIFGDESAVPTSARYRSVYLEGFTCWMEMSSICRCSGLGVLTGESGTSGIGLQLGKQIGLFYWVVCHLFSYKKPLVGRQIGDPVQTN